MSQESTIIRVIGDCFSFDLVTRHDSSSAGAKVGLRCRNFALCLVHERLDALAERVLVHLHVA